MKPDEGNTGVERETGVKFDALLNDLSIYIKSKLEKENSELRQSLSELIPIAERALYYEESVFDYTNDKSDAEELKETKSAIERAKTLTEPKPLERSTQEQPADRSNNSDYF